MPIRSREPRGPGWNPTTVRPHLSDEQWVLSLIFLRHPNETLRAVALAPMCGAPKAFCGCSSPAPAGRICLARSPRMSPADVASSSGPAKAYGTVHGVACSHASTGRAGWNGKKGLPMARLPRRKRG